MTTFTVFIDTNIFIRNKFTFHAGPLNSLKKYCQKGFCTLCTNSIILREVEKHISTDVEKLATQAKNAIKKKPKLVNAISEQECVAIAETLMAAPEKLLAQFSTFMEAAVILPIDNLSLASVFDDYFKSVPPFEQKEAKKAEFPDAVAIMSIKRYLQDEGNVVMCVVSDDEGWKTAFQGQERVCFYKDLRALLTDISKEEVLYNRVADYVGDNILELTSCVEGWLYEQDCSTVIEDFSPCIECDELEDMQIGEIVIVPQSVDYIDTEHNCATVGFSGTAMATIAFSYLDHTEEVYDREDHVWFNTIYGSGSVEIRVPFDGVVNVLFSDGEMGFAEPKLDEVEWGNVDVAVLKMKDHRLDDDPFYDICPDCGKPIGIHNDGGNGFCVACAHRH